MASELLFGYGVAAVVRWQWSMWYGVCDDVEEGRQVGRVHSRTDCDIVLGCAAFFETLDSNKIILQRIRKCCRHAPAGLKIHL